MTRCVSLALSADPLRPTAKATMRSRANIDRVDICNAAFVDGGSPNADSGADFLSTGTMTAGRAVAIVALSSSGSVDVTSNNSAVLEALPTTTGGFLIIAHTAGDASLDFTVGGELARDVPVTVFSP